MRRHALFVTLPICTAIIVAGAWWANAGDLNPPAGPVEQTMVTLQEVYDAISSNSGSGCESCEWQVKGGDLVPDSWQSIFPAGTSGTVRSLVVSYLDPGGMANYRLRQHGAATDYLVALRLNGSATSAVGLPGAGVPCDFRFTNGLEHWSNVSTASFTIYYKLD